MTDNSLMTFGKYKDQPLAQVPDSYLVWLYDNKKAFGDLKKYIEESVPLIQAQIRSKSKNYQSGSSLSK